MRGASRRDSTSIGSTGRRADVGRSLSAGRSSTASSTPNCDSSSASAARIRSAISPAAFSVNVISTMRSGDRSSSLEHQLQHLGDDGGGLAVPAPASMTRLRRRGLPDRAARRNRNVCCSVTLAPRPASSVRGSFELLHRVPLVEVVARPAGVVHRAVLARVELRVVVVRERGERAVEDGAREDAPASPAARRASRRSANANLAGFASPATIGLIVPLIVLRIGCRRTRRRPSHRARAAAARRDRSCRRD